VRLAAEQLEPGAVETARYGKEKVRGFYVVRNPESKTFDVAEYDVTVLVEGALRPDPHTFSFFLQYFWCLVSL
jgi:hypothetical protein